MLTFDLKTYLEERAKYLREILFQSKIQEAVISTQK